MGVGATAVMNEKEMMKDIGERAKNWGLLVSFGVPTGGGNVWGTDQEIDVLLTLVGPEDGVRQRLGVECIYQEGGGTADQKFYAKLEDIRRWPVRGVIVYAGPGWRDSFQSVMRYHGAVRLEDFHQWMKLYFGLPGTEGKAAP